MAPKSDSEDDPYKDWDETTMFPKTPKSDPNRGRRKIYEIGFSPPSTLNIDNKSIPVTIQQGTMEQLMSWETFKVTSKPELLSEYFIDTW